MNTTWPTSSKSRPPKVMVVSCADSRVPPEVVFHMKPGELYVNRAWGNIVDKVILGSLEYGATRLALLRAGRAGPYRLHGPPASDQRIRPSQGQ